MMAAFSFAPSNAVNAPVPSSQDIASPCVGVCALDTDNVCIGCNRTLDEIGEWSSAGTHRKLEILRNVERRRASAPLESHR